MTKIHDTNILPEKIAERFDEVSVPSLDSLDSKSLRVDNELFNEEDSNIVHSVINVKRVKEDWEILVDGKSALLLKGTRFTNTEKDYLRTVDGMKFLISTYKSGKKSVVKIKEELKRFVP